MAEILNSLPYCIICGQSFCDNVVPSKEHIIPEALGNKKIVTYNVCKECNNQLGTHVDSYLTDYFLVKVIRKGKLEKDKNIQLFNDTLENESGEKYKIRSDGPHVIPHIIESDDAHARIIADPGDAMNYATSVLKRKYKKTDEEIMSILNDPKRYVEGMRNVIRPGVFTQNISLDKSRYLLAAIKIGYEYAYYVFGDDYSSDKVSQKLRAYLLSGRKGKHVFSDEEFIDLSKNCHPFWMNQESSSFLDSEIYGICDATPYLLFITKDKTNSLICCIRILNEDFLSFMVLLSEDANRFLQNRSCIISLVTNDGELVEC